MAVEITEFLLSAQSADAKVRTEAESRLRQFQEQNLPGFLLSLSLELSNDGKPLESRRLAGIVLKNSLDAKDATTKEHLVQRWVSNDVAFRSQIKGLLLNTLGSSVSEAGHTAAQVIAKIASIEIPRKEWPELISSLLGNMTQQDRPASLKQSTLEALGYVCEEISHNDLVQDEVNSVLTAVVQGMNVTEQSSVRLAASTALYNALDFAQTNFENEMERNYIMKVVCETAMAKEADIRQAAFECLVSIASTYYDVLEPYMQTLFELTANAVKGDEESVALQAIEFWSSICDEEIELQDFDGGESGDSYPHSRFIEKALSLLVPMLLETLLKQDEDQDQEDGIWNLSMAGGTCLGLVARTVGDAIVPLVMPFVQDNISKPDWRSREAATYAFGSILEGPSVEKLSPMVLSALDFLLNAMGDQNSHVKDTTAWTLSRIFELLHSPATGFSVISPANLQRIVGVLLESIKDSPHVAEKVCGAIYYLAQGYEGFETGSSVLTPYLADVITSLIATAERTDVNDSKLRSAAYETLNEVVRCSNLAETSQIITQPNHFSSPFDPNQTHQFPSPEACNRATMASSTACFLHTHQPLSIVPTNPSPRQVSTKPNHLIVCRSSTTDGAVSRRLALTVLIGAAAVSTKVSPADAAYGEAANVFGKPKKNTDFKAYDGEGFKLSIPAKWNPSKEVEYPGQVLRYEDNFDTTSNLAVMITPTNKKSITDYGAPEEFLSQVNYLLGKQAYFGKTASEGGFEEDAVATANILETSTPVIGGKQYYYLSVLTRTADGDEGGKHQLITATVSDGKLYICKAQAGDKRWFKGARKFVETSASSFSVA